MKMPVLSKSALRVQMRHLLRQMASNEIDGRSKNIIAEIEKNMTFMQANAVLLFVPMADEPQILPLLERWHDVKQLYMPVVCGGMLRVGICDSIADLLHSSEFGIAQPAPLLNIPKIDAAIVPGLAFDAAGYRLGRGRGFYDKFFAQRSMHKIGVCFDFQYICYVPHDEWDAKMDGVISG
jgi:5-formyltetrahydrofolate cyclo-ligase